MKELNEKVVVISGCGQGIGKGVALHLARRGMKVVGMGRRLEPVETTIAEIKAAGGEGLAFAGDVGKREDVDAVMAACVKAYGTVDVVINNAQSLPGSLPVEEVTYEQMLLAWQTGTIGSLFMMQAAFPYMKEQGEGRVINFASATGMFGYETHLAYGSNKEAIRGLTKIAGKEWAKYGITVNCILPGAESPAMVAWSQKHKDEYDKIKAQQPMRRFGDPDMDIGSVCAFLSGPDCRYYTGQCLLVDGGYSIAP